MNHTDVDRSTAPTSSLWREAGDVRDICVIGAGIVGASVAFQLSRFEDVRVSVVDVGYPGAGTTEAGTGWISARGTADARYRELRLLAMDEHHRLATWFPSSPWMTTGGTLQVEDEAADFDSLVEECIAADYPVEVLSAAEVNAQLEPHVAFARPDLRVAHFLHEFTVAGSLLARTLFHAATDNGAIGHFGSRVLRLEQLGERHRVVLDDGTVLEADVVVNAAGARADEIAATYDIAMPLTPEAGMGIHVQAVGNPLRRMITVKELAAKPETDGIIRLRSLVGWKTGEGHSSPDPGFTGGMERNAFVRHVLSQAEQLLPSIAPIRAIATRVGVRPMPADGLPRVGAVSSVPGYFEAVMHSGGVLAPLVGRLLAEEIVTGEQSPELAAYRPDRFLGAPVRTAHVAGDAVGSTL
ncbi:NAD(P)/FAD-dependent oxidoreductase [Georgenia yuyongxinii]|uniref:NAD(P)/FAD-dependent oxidoreductase n=1 Tax=Georgenia yuyongxinii TaxID=2589797 RepID=UPI00163DD93A|nr:FAD-binding oxidoreductase [Georgenia yuyongxinii]